MFWLLSISYHWNVEFSKIHCKKGAVGIIFVGLLAYDQFWCNIRVCHISTVSFLNCTTVCGINSHTVVPVFWKQKLYADETFCTSAEAQVRGNQLSYTKKICSVFNLSCYHILPIWGRRYVSSNVNWLLWIDVTVSTDEGNVIGEKG